MRKRYLSLLLLPFLLSGCHKALELKFVPYDSFLSIVEVKEDNDSSYYHSQKNPNTLVTVGKELSVTSVNDLLSYYPSKKIRTCITAEGEKKILILPICFKDSDSSSLEKKKTFIQNAFFGETKRTNYDSVVGYYNKSSFGHLKIGGEVMDWYQAGYNANEWKTKGDNRHTYASTKLVIEALNKLRDEGVDLTNYDLDNDGIIDGVYAIYDHPLEEKGYDDSLFWAYTFYADKNEYGNTISPMLNAYSWTSVDTITQENNKAYTNYLIHEVGHLFGLSDYYNTKYNLQKNEYHFQPTGCFDMMDYNIGDHSSFSKYLLNWVSPHVIDKKVNNLTISLKSFESSGECLLIPSSNYQNSPFGEYLLIEYFTPTGLNRFEGTYSFSDRDGNTGVYTYPQHHGLRIYHVNASLGYYSYNENSFIGTEYICDAFDPDALTKIGSRTTIGLDFIYSNTIADKDIGNGKVLYHLLEASGENTFKEGKPASNETLFKLDSDFGINHFKDYTFSNGDLVNFTLKVNRISLDKIDITISRVNN